MNLPEGARLTHDEIDVIATGGMAENYDWVAAAALEKALRWCRNYLVEHTVDVIELGMSPRPVARRVITDWTKMLDDIP